MVLHRHPWHLRTTSYFSLQESRIGIQVARNVLLPLKYKANTYIVLARLMVESRSVSNETFYQTTQKSTSCLNWLQYTHITCLNPQFQRRNGDTASGPTRRPTNPYPQLLQVPHRPSILPVHLQQKGERDQSLSSL